MAQVSRNWSALPVPGLFLAGQDVISPAIPGALMGGLLSAASVDRKVFMHMR